MNILSAEQDNIDMLLTQMGAEVKSFHGLICYVNFMIDDTRIFYVYNINSKEQYYLQKVLPYPVGVGEFHKPSDIVDYIEKDLACYKNAAKSSMFKDFLQASRALQNTIQKMDETFLSYNVPHDKMGKILNEIAVIADTLADIQKTSSLITK